MDENVAQTIHDGEIVGICFGLASHNQVTKSSIGDCSISHASQLGNPFLGLPLEFGKCESCGTAEPGNCEGHFGYIELPVPVYHPSHVIELRRLLSLLCLKCLKLKTHKLPLKGSGVLESLLSPCCQETAHVSIKESKTMDGAVFLELKLPTRSAKSRFSEGAWNFLDRYGYRYGDSLSRTLLPSEVSVILKRLPEDTKRKLAKKGYFPQDGYVLHYLPVPPNCLTVPDISDGVIVMSSDLSTTMLKKVLKQIEIIKSSRSGEPNFESHEVEANELQLVIAQYLQFRGAGKASRDMAKQYGFNKEVNDSSTKAWLEKMRTLFISKGSGFSSRSVITGDAYKRVNEIGIPSEIAHKITFEERVNDHNINYLQSLVDNNLCLTYKDGRSTYSLREGSKGHTFLKPGQVIHRRIMDGDIVFVNRPPTTHKHSLQALYVYIHDDRIVKINPLMCGPLAADFDGDCVHLFYPQSLGARAEVLELFSVEKQLLSSHTGNLNLQLATDALLSLKIMLSVHFLDKSSAQQLAMFASAPLPPPALQKSFLSGPRWTALQVLQTALPSKFDCSGERYLIQSSDILSIDFKREAMSSIINEVVASIFFEKGPQEALRFFDSLQPLLMENIYTEGFSVGLRDFFIPSTFVHDIQLQIQDVAPLLFQLRSTYNELVELQLDKYIKLLKVPMVNFILKSSALGYLIDSKSEAGINKVVQQIGFLGLQLFIKGKFYSRSLVDDISTLFQRKYPYGSEFPSEEFGLIKSSFFHGLDPYEAIVHSIATREVIIRSSRGLAEPGTLFKNLMAILRDVAICYDGSVRNISSNSIIQFDYGFIAEKSQSLFPAGEPVGVLAATAMSNPAYKAVLDSSPSSNSSWDMMKEILFCRVNFRNDILDRRVILYLNDCPCGGKYCRERASCLVKNLLKKVSLRDAAVEFLIEYKSPADVFGTEIGTGLIGHIHLNKALLNESNIDMHDVLQKCEHEINLFRKKKNFSYHFKRILVSVSECCFFQHGSRWLDMPCLKFFWQDVTDNHLEKVSHIMADLICPVLLDTIIKGDPRISTVNVIWMSPDSTTWIRGPSDTSMGELAVEVVLEKKAVKQSGDAWRIVLDCCLPVFHLIDTTRSIPYAIKQIQDLLGISCAFDQAVQRLSTSVTMVARGVLKEHLILLASSMTCAGTLIGFNVGGIKALCRALGVQVPFTEATLYTPRKCFERAAEKCHLDSLSSIVASCSWGKRVAIGTGAKFDVLWHTTESKMLQGGIDVYDFLQLVRGSNREELDTGCLGEDVDNFDPEDEFMEQGWSPEPDTKAVFEDSVEMELDLENQVNNDRPSAASSWDTTPSSNNASGGNKSQDWSSWEPKKAKSQQEDSSWKAPSLSQPLSNWGEQNKVTAETGLNDKNVQSGPSHWNSSAELHQPSSSLGWGSTDNGVGNETAKDASWGKTSSWKKNDTDSSRHWDSSCKPNQAASSGAWDSVKHGAHVESTDTALEQPSIPSSKKDSLQTAGNWSSDKSHQSASSGGWESNRAGADNKSQRDSSWGQPSDPSLKKEHPQGAGNWGSNKSHYSEPSDGWTSKGNRSQTESPSGQLTWKKNSSERDMGWESSESQPPASSGGWESKRAGADNRIQRDTSWGQRSEPNCKKVYAESAGDWGSNKSYHSKPSDDWSSKGNRSQSESARGQHDGSTWKKNSSEHGMGTESSNEIRKGVSSPGWGSAVTGDGSKKESEIPWGQPSGSTWRRINENDASNGSGNHSSWGQPSVSTQMKSDAERTQDLKSSSEIGGAAGSLGSDSGKIGEGDSEPKSPWGQPSGASWKKSIPEVGDGNESETHTPWGQPSGAAWKKSIPEVGDNNECETHTPWGQRSTSTWKKNSGERAQAWGSSREPHQVGSQGLDSGNVGDASESEPKSPWGQPRASAWKKNREGSNSGEWRSRNRPPNSPRMPREGPPSVPLTATRQRLDIFTAEEQDILSEVEEIMQSIRKIMHRSGYNDGDRLSVDDQLYILDNIFTHHPEKAAKMGAGIDHIMVAKHHSFQDSRCFYVVTTDGQKEDFSYLKCLENLIRAKHPDRAESFIGKYFIRPRGSREQGDQDKNSRDSPGSTS
ncbi:hypothetical protein Dimus_007118 [Dionaea muscipula]